MRLWHHEMIDLLPKSQLLAQWRELNSIFAKEDRHILINYIYEYPKEHLFAYTSFILQEMRIRNINIRTIDKMNCYFSDIEQTNLIDQPFSRHHDDEYFEICYFNLKEKFFGDRGILIENVLDGWRTVTRLFKRKKTWYDEPLGQKRVDIMNILFWS